MQVQSLDRIISVRTSGAGLVPEDALKVVPVAPVNPVSSHASPGVVVHIDRSDPNRTPYSGEPVYTSVSDPTRRGSEAATAEKDWTIHRPEADKPVDPPQEPISKMMLEFLQTMWRASGSAIDAALARQQAPPAGSIEPPSQPAAEDATYSPAKIKKTVGL